MSLINKLLGRGKVFVDMSTHPSMPLLPVLNICFSLNWFKYRTFVTDPVTFLLVTEKMCEHPRDGTDFEYKFDDSFKGKLTTQSIIIPAYALPRMQEVCGKVGPEVYTLIKKYDLAMDKMAEEVLKSTKYTEELKQMVRARPSLMSQYKREHAKLHGYKDPLIVIPDNGMIN